MDHIARPSGSFWTHAFAVVNAVFCTSVGLFVAAYIALLVHAYDADALLDLLWVSTGAAGVSLGLLLLLANVSGKAAVASTR